MAHDVIIIGGSFAGLSAAMQLARARRDVLILDTSTPRNRYATTSHGFPGQDGQTPAAIASTLRAELSSYATIQIRGAEAMAASRQGDAFVVSLSDSEEITTRRLILAYGVRDILPELPGVHDRWGTSVLHCPYCHGYELNRQPVGVLARNEMAMHQAMLLPDWGPTTLFTQGILKPTQDQRQTLAKRGAIIEEVPVTGLVGPAPALEAVRLADGREIPLAGLFIVPQTAPSSNIGTLLGCEIKDGPTGPYLAVDGMQATSISGVFAAGDLASPMPNATLAAAAGVLAGGAAHRSLIVDPDFTETV